MPVIKLTIQEVQKATPENGRETIYRDTDVSGFSLKVTPSNNKIFFFQYRIGGRAGISRKIKIGKFPAIKPDDARKIAIQYAAEVARKLDPQERLKKEETVKLRSQENSFGKLFNIYYEKQLAQNRSGDKVKRIVERVFFPALGRVAIAEIDRLEINKIIDVIYKGSKKGPNGQKEIPPAPYSANRALSHVKTFFRWVVSEGYLQGDPTSVMQKPFKGEIQRERVLTLDELRLLWPQFTALECQPFGNAIKLLLLTGQRREEVGSMQWEHLDLHKGLWSMPRSSTKNKLPHVVPLVGLALEIVKSQVRLVVKDRTTGKSAPSPYVFTTTGTTPISGWSRIKQTIDNGLIANETVVGDWRFHDLRRTVSTNLGDLGYHDEDIGMLLNHQSRGVTAIYNRSSYLTKKHEMLEKWEEKLNSTLQPK
jgi:integrase